MPSTSNSDKGNPTRRPEYAGPAFYNSPPPSSLPTPKFLQPFSSVSNVILASGAREPPLDAITYVKQVSSDLEENDTKGKAVSVTSDIKPHDGKRDRSAAEEQNKSADMVRLNRSRCSITSCLTHRVQKPKNTSTACAPRSEAFEELINRLEAKKMKEQQAKKMKKHQELEEILEIQRRQQAKKMKKHQELEEILEIQRRQQAIIERIESDSTNAIGRDTPQDTRKIQSQGSMIFPPRATPGRRNTPDVDEATDRRERTAGGSSSEHARAKDRIPAMEMVSGPAISASPHIASNVIPVESEKTAFEDDGEADQETFEAKETEEAEKEAEDLSALEQIDDEGYVHLQGTVGGKFSIVAP